MSIVITKFGTEIDLSYEHHTACPVCRKTGGDGAGDNLYVYGLDENGKHRGCRCFACGWSYPSQEYIEQNEEYDWEAVEGMGLEFNPDVLAEIKEEYEFIENSYRGIRPDTYKYFGVMHKVNEDGELIEQIYPTFVGKDVKGFKRRELPKKFLTPYGETGKSADLFGQFRFLKSTSRDVLIVGGEIDQMSAFQILKDFRDRSNKSKNQEFPYTPVVSSTIGEHGTAAQVQSQYDWLNRFDRIIVCLDNDTAGHEAVDKLFPCIPKGKMYVLDLDLKDANEYLVQGKEREFIDLYFKARPYTPAGIIGSSALSVAIREHAMTEKVPLPPYMHKLQKMMAGGIPLGKIVNLISSSGTGKSTHVEEIVYHWIFHSPYKIGIVSLESDAGEYGTKLLSRHIGRKINLIESVEEKLAYINSDYVKQKEYELFTTEQGTDRFMLDDDRDGGVETTKSLIEKMIMECDCKVIVVDPLQDLIACLTDDEQNKFMSWQKGLCKSHNVIFFNVNHTKKALTGGGAGSQGVNLVEEDTHGSSSIYKSGACNLLFSRNKEAEDEIERNTTHMKMSKCRWTGATSPYAGKYFYDNKTHTVYDYDDYVINNPDVISSF